MQIIDTKTGKRISKADKTINKDLAKKDPIKRNAEKGLEPEDELSPMDPPSAYDQQFALPKIEAENMPAIIQTYMEEHKVALEKIKLFEEALSKFKENNYQLDGEINNAFSTFFNFFDNNLLDHNQREEKQLFSLLHKRLIETGECGEGDPPQTSVDMMEDDHVKIIQLGTLAFNLLGMAPRLFDEKSCRFVYDTAYNSARELTELLQLHIYREDNILFPLAYKLISKETFVAMAIIPKKPSK